MTFKKGDPRINRKGRPRDIAGVKALGQEIANEIATIKGEDGKPKEWIQNGHKVTIIEAILRSWATSTDPRKQLAYVEYCYGKVPQQQELTGADGGPIETVVKIVKGVSYDDL
jgi:hypothetical protein